MLGDLGRKPLKLSPLRVGFRNFSNRFKLSLVFCFIVWWSRSVAPGANDFLIGCVCRERLDDWRVFSRRQGLNGYFAAAKLVLND